MGADDVVSRYALRLVARRAHTATDGRGAYHMPGQLGLVVLTPPQDRCRFCPRVVRAPLTTCVAAKQQDFVAGKTDTTADVAALGLGFEDGVRTLFSLDLGLLLLAVGERTHESVVVLALVIITIVVLQNAKHCKSRNASSSEGRIAGPSRTLQATFRCAIQGHHLTSFPPPNLSQWLQLTSRKYAAVRTRQGH